MTNQSNQDHLGIKNHMFSDYDLSNLLIMLKKEQFRFPHEDDNIYKKFRLKEFYKYSKDGILNI